MNVLSLFSGVGGADLGLERAGMEIIGQCEVNASARKILERHWPDVPLSEDITQLDEDWLLSHGIATRNHPAEGKTVDLVVGGFPCQDLSIAGKRKGLEGARSGLFHDAVRIANLVLSDGVSEVDGELYVQPEPERVRRLTPTECERLQGFPDGWTIADPELAAGPDPNPPPDTPRYHQMGNAITVPVAEWIGHRIIHQNQKEDQTND